MPSGDKPMNRKKGELQIRPFKKNPQLKRPKQNRKHDRTCSSLEDGQTFAR